MKIKPMIKKMFTFNNKEKIDSESSAVDDPDIHPSGFEYLGVFTIILFILVVFIRNLFL